MLGGLSPQPPRPRKSAPASCSIGGLQYRGRQRELHKLLASWRTFCSLAPSETAEAVWTESRSGHVPDQRVALCSIRIVEMDLTKLRWRRDLCLPSVAWIFSLVTEFSGGASK